MIRLVNISYIILIITNIQIQLSKSDCLGQYYIKSLFIVPIYIIYIYYIFILQTINSIHRVQCVMCTVNTMLYI